MPDAANMAAVLYRLRNQQKGPAYRRILASIRRVAPFFEDFELNPSGVGNKDIILNWRQRDSDQVFGPHQLSDGTLRAMALITLLQQPVDDLPDLMVVDEPELGLHPAAMTIVAGLFKKASHHSQVVVATQSAAMLDAFDPQDVVVVERDADDKDPSFSVLKRQDCGNGSKNTLWASLGEERPRWRTALMKRLYLTVEGQTEQTFAVEVLRPHLVNYDVFLVKPRLTGLHARRKGRIPQGGLLGKFEHSLVDIRRWLLEDRSPDARFSMMVDLYGLPKDFPGYEEAMASTDPFQQANMMERALATELGDPRFVPYLQVHEFEALVLSKPGAFNAWFEDMQKQVVVLEKECQAFDTPEKINHGQQTHPKARIKKHIQDYDEDVDGPTLAGDIGLETIRASCPHFDQWLSRLERLDAGAENE